MNHFLSKFLIILITLISVQSLYAQTEEDDLKEFSKRFPTPKGSYTNMKEALANPEKVLYLTLGMRGFDKFPIEILKFKNLIDLDLYNNNITEIPTWIIKLTKLKKLSVRSNKLKTIPESVFYLPSLTELDLWGNQINTFPILTSEKLPVLEDINLSMNDFYDFPTGVEKLVRLKKLRLENNKLSRVSDVVFKMQSLEYIYLFHNNIFKIDLKLPVATKLKGVFLDSNPINEAELMRLRKLVPNCDISME